MTTYQTLTQEESERQTRIHDKATRAIFAALDQEYTDDFNRRIVPPLAGQNGDGDFVLTLRVGSRKEAYRLVFSLKGGEYDQAKSLYVYPFFSGRYEIPLNASRDNQEVSP